MTQSPDLDAEAVTKKTERLRGFASPAASRNAIPIAEALRPYLPPGGLVVEIAAGSGYHTAVLAAHFPDLVFQPTEADHQAIEVMQELVETATLENLKDPVILNVEAEAWPLDRADALLCCNMIHITPWSVAEGLFAGAGRILESGAPLFLYGPFSVEGQHTAPSNAAFDQSLRMQNPTWGVRDSENVDGLAAEHDLELKRSLPMPANNMIRIYHRNP